MIQCLLIEDDQEIAENIKESLENTEEYKVTLVNQCASALAFASVPYDVILLDFMLPDENGLICCKELRKTQHCPILFISCIDDDSIIIEALNQGSDDYLVKPFSIDMLDAKIKANLRRIEIDTIKIKPSIQSLNKLVLDPLNKTMTYNKQTIVLGNMEFRILAFFIEHPHQYYTSKELYKTLWGKPSLGDTRTVLVHIHNLRRKIEKDPAKPYIIKNIQGKGYVFDDSAL